LEAVAFKPPGSLLIIGGGLNAMDSSENPSLREAARLMLGNVRYEGALATLLHELSHRHGQVELDNKKALEEIEAQENFKRKQPLDPILIETLGEVEAQALVDSGCRRRRGKVELRNKKALEELSAWFETESNKIDAKFKGLLPKDAPKNLFDTENMVN